MSSHGSGIRTRFVFARQKWNDEENTDSWQVVEVTDYTKGIVEIQTRPNEYVAFRLADLMQAIKGLRA